jgi:hypothetical protein
MRAARHVSPRPLVTLEPDPAPKVDFDVEEQSPLQLSSSIGRTTE